MMSKSHGISKAKTMLHHLNKFETTSSASLLRSIFLSVEGESLTPKEHRDDHSSQSN